MYLLCYVLPHFLFKVTSLVKKDLDHHPKSSIAPGSTQERTITNANNMKYRKCNFSGTVSQEFPGEALGKVLQMSCQVAQLHHHEQKIGYSQTHSDHSSDGRFPSKAHHTNIGNKKEKTNSLHNIKFSSNPGGRISQQQGSSINKLPKIIDNPVEVKIPISQISTKKIASKNVVGVTISVKYTKKN